MNDDIETKSIKYQNKIILIFSMNFVIISLFKHTFEQVV